MDYGALPTKWKVTGVTVDDLPFDLERDDELELAGATIKRRRLGSPPIDWGRGCTFDPKSLTIKGNHDGTEFLITIELGGTRLTHKGDIGGPGTGANGTWTAEEGG